MNLVQSLRLLWRIIRFPLLAFVSYGLLVVGLGFYLFSAKLEPVRYQTHPDGKLESVSDLSLRPDGQSVLTFYALGDWGTADQHQKQVGLLLDQDLSTVGDRDISPFVLEAGDNVYENGLASGWDNPDMMAQLTEVIEESYTDIQYQDAPIEYHLVAGNHDHLGDMALWETYAEGRFAGQNGTPIIKSYNQHHPDIADTNDKSEYYALNQSDDLIELPEQILIDSADALFIAIDSQKMLELYYRRTDKPELQVDLDAHWQRLALLASEDRSWTFILAHHPVSTFGPHLGKQDSIPYRLFKTLLFFVNNYGDLDHPAYQAFIADFDAFSIQYPLIFIAGHDHSLQLNIVSDTLLQVVSGAAGKATFVIPGEETVYAYARRGFVRFDVTPEELWIEFIDVSDNQLALYRLKKDEEQIIESGSHDELMSEQSGRYRHYVELQAGSS